MQQEEISLHFVSLFLALVSVTSSQILLAVIQLDLKEEEENYFRLFFLAEKRGKISKFGLKTSTEEEYFQKIEYIF